MSERACRFCDVVPVGGLLTCPKYDAVNRVHCPSQLGFSDELHRMQYEIWWLNEYGPHGLQNSLNDIRENGT